VSALLDETDEERSGVPAVAERLGQNCTHARRVLGPSALDRQELRRRERAELREQLIQFFFFLGVLVVVGDDGTY
jgi:hypothetical protein